MIKCIKIENFKSIKSINIELGRINVLIGENGCGKSNILEAIALGSAAKQNKLDNEFLFSRGIRVTEAKFMRSAFDNENIDKPIKIGFHENDNDWEFELENDNKPYSHWHYSPKTQTQSLFAELEKTQSLFAELEQNVAELRNLMLAKNNKEITKTQNLFNKYSKIKSKFFKILESMNNFVIYSPENSALRKFTEEGQIQPLGISGEGLFKLVNIISTDKERFEKLKECLHFIGWFKNFSVPPFLSEGEFRLDIEDRYLCKNNYFTQKSANEGFLFLLFYFSLFISNETPNFFAIDNIDASLNPKMCTRLMEEITKLAKEEDKQAILTTHNASILDGLDLNDDEQRLFVISRNLYGYTKIKRVYKPKTEKPMKLSTMLLEGYIGGLPKEF